MIQNTNASVSVFFLLLFCVMFFLPAFCIQNHESMSHFAMKKPKETESEWKICKLNTVCNAKKAINWNRIHAFQKQKNNNFWTISNFNGHRACMSVSEKKPLEPSEGDKSNT